MARLCYCTTVLHKSGETEYLVCSNCDSVQDIEYESPELRVKTWQDMRYALNLTKKIQIDKQKENLKKEGK